MATQLPPLPTDSNSRGSNTLVSPGVSGASGNPSPVGSPFSGGLPGMMQAIQQVEAGYKMLVQMLPSLAPIAAEGISKLRMAVPNAMSSGPGGGAGQGLPPQPMPQPTPQGQ